MTLTPRIYPYFSTQTPTIHISSSVAPLTDLYERYQHDSEMWKCQPASGVWKHANNLLAAMSLPTLTSIYDLPNIILLDRSIKNVIA